jgi:hypothetical protein
MSYCKIIFFHVFVYVNTNNLCPFNNYLSRGLYARIVGIPIYLFVTLVAPS